MARIFNFAVPYCAKLLGNSRFLGQSNVSAYTGSRLFCNERVNPTVQDWLRKWHKNFLENQISEPLESIANLLAFALKTNRISEVYKRKDKQLSIEEQKVLEKLCRQRLQRMPVQYIIGEWDFRSITLKLRPPVFIPRPETEMLVELVLQHIKRTNTRSVLELCCGSGAISLSLLKEIPQLEVFAIDKSAEACKLCMENARLLNVDNRLRVENISVEEMQQVHKQGDNFAVVVSNPPYVPDEEMLNLQPEILLFEDLEALKGGQDGLVIVRQIFNVSSGVLSPGGSLFLEVDPSHPALIDRELMKNLSSPLRLHTSHNDLCSRSRFVEIIKDRHLTAT